MNSILRRHVLFGAYSLGLAVANADVLGAMIDFSRRNETASHLVLIPFVTLALIVKSRDSIFSSVRWAVPAGAVVVVVGLALSLLGRLYVTADGGNDALSLMVGTFVVCWLGGFLLFYGRDAFRAALFPLLFLAFMVPMPTALLDAATLFLKRGSTEAVAGLFTVTGTPYYRDGFEFHLSKVVIVIVDECSGIRSSIALLLTGLLAGDMFLKSAWKKAVLIAVILPIALLKNGIRIVSLSLLAMHVDPGFLTGQLHHEGGIVFFLLALAILAPLLVLLRKSETDVETRQPQSV
jgi:exosortase